MEEEANDIAEAFPEWDFDSILMHLRAYEDSYPNIRKTYAIRDYLLKLDSSVDVENTIREAAIIHKIFPKYSESALSEKLMKIGNEPNRMKLIIKDIVINDNKLFVNLHTRRMNGVTSSRKRKSLDFRNHPPLIDLDEDSNDVIPIDDSDAPLKERPLAKRVNINSGESIKKSLDDILNEFVENINKPTTSHDTTINMPMNANNSVDDIINGVAAGKIEILDDLIDNSIPPTCKRSHNSMVVEADSTKPNKCGSDGNVKVLYQIMEIFPDADTHFLRELVGTKEDGPNVIDELIDVILNMPAYPKRVLVKEEETEIDPEAQIEILKQVLPDADPDYLMRNLQQITTQDELKLFISNAMDSRNYPTIKEYLRKQQLSAQVKQYTTEFDVEKFLELIPDPESYFEHADCKASKARGDNDYFHMLTFLRNKYCHLRINTIKYVFDKTLNLLEACNKLDQEKDCMKIKRKLTTVNLNNENIPLLQIFAYISNKEGINRFLLEKKQKMQDELQEAKNAGILVTCQCCYDDEVMPKNIVKCPSGCVCCKSCVEKSVEILFGEGKLEYKCLVDCGSLYTLQILQSALKPKLFSKMALKKQLEEVKAAGIEELEMCPFCDFATIPAPGDKTFVCHNPDCMKESCRECKEPSHIPLKCDEVEKDTDVKRRTYVEDKMTEALVRKCWKCAMKFIKEDGCNKMTCSCGAMMCYICNQPVTNYKHFNGQGGDRLDLCPLYSDTNLLHKEAVLKSAMEAKAEIGGVKLVIDPSADVNRHYHELAQKHPTPAHNADGMLMQGLAMLQNHVVYRLPLNPRRNHHHHHHHRHHPDAM